MRKTAAAFLLIFASLALAHQQASGGSDQGDSFAQAMDHLRTARGLLHDYVAKNPNSDKAYFANIQLKALNGLIVSDVPFAPIPMDTPVAWRIVSIDPGEAATKVTLEMINQDENNPAIFRWFDRTPLEIMANGKKYSQKQDTLALPAGMKVFDYSGANRMKLSPGQKVQATVYFDSLDDGVTAGQIEFAGAGAPILHFNLLNKTLRP